MNERIDALYGYVQERCLWQFFSRTWDRQTNIDNTIAMGTALLLKEKPVATTPAERCNLVDAQVMVSDFQARFPWIAQCTAQELQALMAGLKARLTEIAITKSRNRELNHELY